MVPDSLSVPLAISSSLHTDVLLVTPQHTATAAEFDSAISFLTSCVRHSPSSLVVYTRDLEVEEVLLATRAHPRLKGIIVDLQGKPVSEVGRAVSALQQCRETESAVLLVHSLPAIPTDVQTAYELCSVRKTAGVPDVHLVLQAVRSFIENLPN